MGLIKGYLWSDSATAAPKYNKDQDTNANGMYVYATVKGTDMAKMPKKAGILVFKTNALGRINHVGVYIGDDYVIEAKGHAYGVVKTRLTGGGWKRWSECPYITYTDTEEDNTEKEDANKVTVKLSILKNGSKGEETKTLQRLLRAEGYDVGAAGTDGSFGKITEKAVKAYQKDKGLTVDGIVGAKTWAAILGTV